jgi:aminoglycoside 6-adenylyltransferase
MLELPDERAVLDRIVSWGEADDAVRALVLTSTRTRPGGPVDLLSDYDVIAVLTDVERFDERAAYGVPMAHWGDEHDVHGTTTYFRGVVYEDGVKVDWTLWPDAVPALVAEHGLTDDLDVGYRVLLDKDGETERWSPPTLRAHIPSRPSEAEYVALVEEFWWSSTYLAKSLWRGEGLFARFVLDGDLKHGALRRMLEWLVELDHDWSLRPGAYGRGLERLLPPDARAELAALDGRDAWEAFERMAALFRRAATAVGNALGYGYPLRVDELTCAYLERIRELPSHDRLPAGCEVGE